MNRTGRPIVCLMIILTAQMLSGCAGNGNSLPEISPTPESAALAVIIATPNPDYAYAQSTMDTGQSQLLELSQRATQMSIEMALTAGAAALATQEYVQRQKVEFDTQSTAISQNIAMAAATQEYLRQQTKMAQDAIALAQSSAAAATQSASVLNETQTVQAQLMVNAWVQQTEQAAAYLTAYPLTQTPLAATEAALLMLQYDQERRAFEDRVIAPLIPFVVILLVFLGFLGIILVLSWFAPRYMSGTSSRRTRSTDGYDLTNPNSRIRWRGRRPGTPTAPKNSI